MEEKETEAAISEWFLWHCNAILESSGGFD